MIQFKEINGTLCRMVEPEPIFASTKAPFVIVGKNTKHPTIITQDMDILLRIFLVAYSDEFEIIGYPVVEGSAEWALYQMMHGKWVVCDGLHPPCHLHANMVTWMVSKFPARWEVQSPDKWVLYCVANTGWQLYEPKQEPQPAYAVGDWVEVDGTQRHIEVIGRDLGKGRYYHFYGHGGVYEDEITRKLDPSEVIVHIGCLSGTVMANGSPFMETDTGFWLVSLDSEEHENCYIPFTMCDPATSSLVERLLKAQEEK